MSAHPYPLSCLLRNKLKKQTSNEGSYKHEHGTLHIAWFVTDKYNMVIICNITPVIWPKCNVAK